jgi:pyruvate dehydrogenase E2 component (dihydrolipoamide acetyltransferase)
MAEVIKMPRLSDTMTDGVVAKWHKKIGDKISEGDLLADIETDKATMEFESFQEGVLLHIGVEETQTAAVDSILAILGEKGEDISALLLDTKSDDNLEEVKTDSNEIEVVVSDTNPINQDAVVISKTDTKETSSDPNRLLKISPLAKRMAKEQSIDVSSINGSGDGGRIIKRDIENYSKPLVNIDRVSTESQDVPITQMRKTIAQRLSQSKFTAPHFYLNMDVVMDDVIKARKDINSNNDIKISFNDILVKAVSMAIKKHPDINASWLDTHITLHSDINIGVAVSIDSGLVVPVIKNADLKSFSQISSETKMYIDKAKSNKLQPSDWNSNTFTISNLGMFGIDNFTAIINSPDACILAVGAIKEKPIVKDGAIAVGNIMSLTLSCDHRVVDGVVGAKFLQTLKNMLESPVMIFC